MCARGSSFYVKHIFLFYLAHVPSGAQYITIQTRSNKKCIYGGFVNSIISGLSTLFFQPLRLTDMAFTSYRGNRENLYLKAHMALKHTYLY